MGRAISGGAALALVVVSLLAESPAGGVASPESVGETYANAVAVDTEGRIIVLGTGRPCVDSSPQCESRVELRRYLPDGRPDSTFGEGGAAEVSTVASSSFGGLALQPNGRIVVLGMGDAPALVGFRPDGALDLTFGDGGVSWVDGLYVSSANALASDSAGRLLVAGGVGGTPGTEMAVGRFNADGRIDTSFGAAGIAAVRGDPYDDAEYGGAVAARPDGRLLLVGSTSGQSRDAVVAVALQSDGNPDSSFGDQGIAVVTQLSDAYSLRIAPVLMRENGHAVITMTALGDPVATKGSCPSYRTFQLTPAGGPDSAFGNGGLAPGPGVACAPAARGAALDSDGGATVVGTGGDYGRKLMFTSVRYASDGALDPRFGTGGATTFGVAGQSSSAQAVAVTNGATITVGELQPRYCPAHGSSFCSAAWIVRQSADGSLDRSFGRGGVVTEPWAHLCPRSPTESCGPNLNRSALRRLLSESFPSFARVANGKVRARVSCAYRVEMPCRVSLTVARRRGAPKLGSVAAKVRAGHRRVLRLPVVPRRLDTVLRARRLFFRAEVTALGQRPVEISGSVPR